MRRSFTRRSSLTASVLRKIWTNTIKTLCPTTEKSTIRSPYTPILITIWLPASKAASATLKKALKKPTSLLTVRFQPRKSNARRRNRTSFIPKCRATVWSFTLRRRFRSICAALSPKYWAFPKPKSTLSKNASAADSVPTGRHFGRRRRRCDVPNGTPRLLPLYPRSGIQYLFFAQTDARAR